MLAQHGWRRIWRHLWCDERTVRSVLPADVQQRLTERVAASEGRHTGEVRFCIEAALPISYLRREAPSRERAVMLFGKLGVWDTAHRNGVLIYLLLADHAIEILADRGLNQHVTPEEWAAIAERMAGAFKGGRYEDGLTQALEEVSALLVAHFPADETTHNPNELPNQPVLLG